MANPLSKKRIRKPRKKGIIEKDIEKAFNKYRQDKNLLSLLKSIGETYDNHIHYEWQRHHCDITLERLFKNILAISNPSHREGDVSNEKEML